MITGLINPLLTEGQVQGGVAQGIGQALLEHTVYDPGSGQLLSGSLMDYAVPRAEDLPLFDITLDGCRPCQPAGREGRRAGRRMPRRRRSSPPCSMRCAARDRPHRHAGDAGTGLARDTAGAKQVTAGGSPVSAGPLSLSPPAAGSVPARKA